MNRLVIIIMVQAFCIFATNLKDATAIDKTYFGTYSGRFLPGDLKFADLPTGHAPGKDNYLTDSLNRFHFPGEDCGICHAPGRKASNHTFSMSGTFYKDKAGREPLVGAEVVLVDSAGKTISMTSNEVGNFATRNDIASDPASGLPVTNTSSWRYKTWVKYGDRVVPMVTVAQVGSGTSRMSCSMHHAPKNSRGALFVPTDSVNKTVPGSISFKTHVLPVLRMRCKSCHMPRTTSTGNMVTYSTIWGKNAGKYQYDGGLNLMTYSKTGAGGTSSAKGAVDVANTTLLTKTTVGGDSHAGGWYWDITDNDYKVIQQWIAEGAQDN